MTNNFQSVQAQEEGVFNAAPPLNPPPNPATRDYKLNHLAIRIRDPAQSLHFYVDLLGMRIVFTMNAGPFTIYYLGHPPAEARTEEDISNWAKKTSEIPIMTKTAGLLELYHTHGAESGGISTGNEPPSLGFSHLGFTVPDVPAAVKRLRDGGVSILKDVGVCSRDTVPLSEWEAERGIGRGEIHENYAWFFEKFAMVADPVSIPRLVSGTNANGKGWIYGGVDSPEDLIEALMSLSKDSKVSCTIGRAVICTRQKPTADV
ncbi:uncharacterized protein MYU51_012103 [Penicillium brevicompactum]|uniref:uncharacterized protein n=1 Tax=Penicillium brevicompactum TaxID=5074 RepID=UPI00254262F0|nr:uncharacterized protein N7506_002446 [Penicillium brevicompactum]KAJ5344081.1 hypothetical protein N7506_002446 [Penicillium brevicompactum]